MATITTFEEITAWQKARVLQKKIWDICKKDAIKRDFNFVNQITDAARSVMANIAEGFESLSQNQFIEFLGYAKRSAGEVRAHLYCALDSEYITEEEFHELSVLSKEVCSVIAGFMRYLKTQDNKRKRNL